MSLEYLVCDGCGDYHGFATCKKGQEPMSDPITVGSLFAGVGGFDIAAERAGMKVVWQSEYDKPASRVLEHHWPGLNLGDIHGIESPPAVDVLCGGFPCQDYSVAGNREGLAGDRGALWWEYLRLIGEGRPTWVVAENVPGLLSSRDGEDFATIIDSLTECGYGVVWCVLDAQYFGVAQRRRRIFIIGHSGGQPQPEILALSEGVSGHPEPRRQERQDVAADVAFSSSGKSITGSLTTKFGPKNYSNHQEVGAGSLVFKRERSDLIAFTANDDGSDMIEEISPTLRSGSAGGVYPAIAMRQREGKPGGGKGPLLSHDRSLTLAANTNDQTLFQASTVRRLTPLECERLQGFPDGWTDIPDNPDSQRYRQMGNAVAVPVVEWILKRIVTEGGT